MIVLPDRPPLPDPHSGLYKDAHRDHLIAIYLHDLAASMRLVVTLLDAIETHR